MKKDHEQLIIYINVTDKNDSILETYESEPFDALKFAIHVYIHDGDYELYTIENFIDAFNDEYISDQGYVALVTRNMLNNLKKGGKN